MASKQQIYPVFLQNAGCRERCIFCAQDRSAPGQGIDLVGLRNYLEGCLPLQGEGEIAYYGGSFTRLSPRLQQQLLELAGEMVAAGRASGIRISTRPDALGGEEIARLHRASVQTVEIGCQSFSPAVLKACYRSYAPECVAPAVENLRRVGIRIGLQLMPGLPQADEPEAFTSLAQALGLRPDFVRLYPAVVLRGTPLEALWRQGGYRPWSLARTLRVGAGLVAQAHAAGIPVIRFGLQASRELDENVVAGPYHPALGQMVKARLWLDAFRRCDLRRGEELAVHRADLSDAHGYRRRNRRLLGRISAVVIKTADHIPRGHYCWRGNLYNVPGLAPAGETSHDAR